MGTGMNRDSKYGAPLLGWRMTMASAPSEVTVHPVSMSDSPFSILEDVAVMSVVVAPSAFAANSNDVRVRVDGS